MSSTQTALARAIEVQRIRAGISKGELAKRAGLGRASLSKRLAGDVPIRTDEIDRLAEALGVDPFDLMDDARSERSRGCAAA